jgi:hypothetical protein
MDYEDPTADDALTVDEMIAQLEAIRLKWGGDVRIFMCDAEPVVRIGCCEGSVRMPRCDSFLS